MVYEEIFIVAAFLRSLVLRICARDWYLLEFVL